jgi:Uri superfamily endonuclease
LECPPPLPKGPGLYILLLALEAPLLAPSRSGTVKLGPGIYAYIGSAGAGLRGRVCRHITSPRKLRWHVDVLTTSNWSALLAVAWSEGAWGVSWEDRLASTLCRLGEAPAPGFGASDSRGGERLCRLEDCVILPRALSLFGGDWSCALYAPSSLYCGGIDGFAEACLSLRTSRALTRL